jgi:putative ABC transport system permease protein
LFGVADRFTEPQVKSIEKAEHGIVVVSQTTARTLWPDRPAIGESLWLADNVDNVGWREVVGVVEDIQFYAVGEDPAMHIFVPWTQHPSGRPQLVVKAAGNAAGIIATVRDVITSVEPGTKIDRVATLESLVSRATAQPRFTTATVAAFGALALLLAAVGIYGTLSYVVGARTREIGIRLALGAPRPGLMLHVVARGLAPALVGGAIGVAIAVALARTFRALLYGIEPLDAASFAAGAALLLMVALAAAIGPAVRASRVSPAAALRTD